MNFLTLTGNFFASVCDWNWLSLLYLDWLVCPSLCNIGCTVVCIKARPQVALDVSRVHPATRMGAPIPTSSSPPTPSSMRSASTTSSTQSSPQQQPVHLHQPAQQPPTVSGSAATTSLTNGTTPSASSSTAGIGGAPPPSRQSEPKDLKYRETPPSAKKKVMRTVGRHASQRAARKHPLYSAQSHLQFSSLLVFFF